MKSLKREDAQAASVRIQKQKPVKGFKKRESFQWFKTMCICNSCLGAALIRKNSTCLDGEKGYCTNSGGKYSFNLRGGKLIKEP